MNSTYISTTAVVVYISFIIVLSLRPLPSIVAAESSRCPWWIYEGGFWLSHWNMGIAKVDYTISSTYTHTHTVLKRYYVMSMASGIYVDVYRMWWSTNRFYAVWRITINARCQSQIWANTEEYKQHKWNCAIRFGSRVDQCSALSPYIALDIVAELLSFQGYDKGRCLCVSSFNQHIDERNFNMCFLPWCPQFRSFSMSLNYCGWTECVDEWTHNRAVLSAPYGGPTRRAPGERSPAWRRLNELPPQEPTSDGASASKIISNMDLCSCNANVLVYAIYFITSVKPTMKKYWFLIRYIIGRLTLRLEKINKW